MSLSFQVNSFPSTYNHYSLQKLPSAEALRLAGLCTLITDLDWRLLQVPDYEEKMISDPNTFLPIGMKAKNCHAVGENLRNVATLMQKVLHIFILLRCQTYPYISSLLFSCHSNPIFNALYLPRAYNSFIYVSIASQLVKDSPSDFTLIVGGDHSLSIGTIPSLIKARPKTGVVWVDAHADINTPFTSLTGNLHGMSVAFLLGLVDHKSLPAFDWFSPCLTPEDIVYIGLRDLDLAEKRVLKNIGIPYTSCDNFVK